MAGPRESQDFAHLRQRQPDGLGFLDERNVLHALGTKDPVARVRPRGLGQKSEPFPEADRLRRHSRMPCERRNGEGLSHGVVSPDGKPSL